MRQLVYLACEKVLDDPRQGQSLISVFHGIKFGWVEGQELPGNAVVPKEWAIYTKWDLLTEEEGKPYTSSVEFFWPDGTEFTKAELDASQPTAFGMAFTHRLNGFPVGQHGNLRILNTLLSEGVVVAGPLELEIRIESIPADERKTE